MKHALGKKPSPLKALIGIAAHSSAGVTAAG